MFAKLLDYVLVKESLKENVKKEKKIESKKNNNNK